MKKPVSIAMVAACGYGAHYLQILYGDNVDRSAFVLKGVIDPFVQNSPYYNRLVEEQIPLYNTLEEFYAKDTADLTIISSPLKFHREQILTALANGSHVLCEKPLVTTINVIDELKEAVAKSKKKLAVGFQWSFAPPILELKRDILSGKFGKPVRFKSFTSWKRYDDYYSNGWKGRLLDSKGDLVLDSVATNATAHYLHNIFFMAGDAIDASAMPVTVTGELYRGKDIQSYDSCYLKGVFENGCEFYFIATHAAEEEKNPCFLYEFEHGTAEFNLIEGQTEITASFADGTTKNYGDPNYAPAGEEKFWTMLRAVSEEVEIPCVIDTVLPHLKVCDAMFDKIEIANFPAELCYREEKNPGSFVRGLLEDSKKCFAQYKLPSEAGCPWAVQATSISLKEYTAFTGEKLPK